MKRLLILLCLAYIWTACDKMGAGNRFPESVSINDVAFNFTVNYPKGEDLIKEGWENGDAVFVFLQNFDFFYVKLTFDGVSWKASVNKSGQAPSSEQASSIRCSGQVNVSAVHLPEGNNEKAESYKNGKYYWCFSSRHLFYLEAERVPCSWEKSPSGQMTLSATLDMQFPRDYVQVFIEDPAAADGKCTLGTDVLRTAGVMNICSEDGRISDDVDYSPLVGYAHNTRYGRGYLFSGKMDPLYQYDGYCFSLKKEGDGSRNDLFVPGTELFAGHRSVTLPAVGSAGWQAVGSGKTVSLRAGTKDLGTWHSCNYGASVPEEPGKHVMEDEAVAQGAPTADQFRALMDDCTWSSVSIDAQCGLVASSDTGFIFFPADAGTAGSYWSCSPGTGDDFLLGFYFALGQQRFLEDYSRGMYHMVRPVVK